MNKTVGNNIKALRKEGKMTQGVLSSKVFITRTMLAQYEGGHSLPNVAVLKRIADFFGVTLDEITSEEMKSKFPNGFTDWHEAHHDICRAIGFADNEGSGNKVKEITKFKGHGGLYEFAKDLTDKFQEKYKGIVWGEELEYFDEMEAFIEEELY